MLRQILRFFGIREKVEDKPISYYEVQKLLKNLPQNSEVDVRFYEGPKYFNSVLTPQEAEKQFLRRFDCKGYFQDEARHRVYAKRKRKKHLIDLSRRGAIRDVVTSPIKTLRLEYIV